VEGSDERSDRSEGEGNDNGEDECGEDGDGSDCEVGANDEGESGDDPREEAILLKEFLTTISNLDADGTWNRAYKAGDTYRSFGVSCRFFISHWGRYARGRWVESALRWLKKHPGEDVPGNITFRYPDVRDAWKDFKD